IRVVEKRSLRQEVRFDEADQILDASFLVGCTRRADLRVKADFRGKLHKRRCPQGLAFDVPTRGHGFHVVELLCPPALCGRLASRACCPRWSAYTWAHNDSQ